MYIHRNFTHPGGVSPMKQEKVEEKKVEEKKKKKKAFDYSKKQDYSGGPSEGVQDVMDFLTPQNKLELGLSAVGGFGAGFGRVGSKFLRTKVGQKVANKIPWLKNLTKPITKTAKGAKGTNTTKGDFDFSKKNDYSGGGKPKGGVDGGSVNPNTGYKYDMDVLDVDNPIPSFRKVDLDKVEIPRMKQLGKNLDANNFDASTLTKDNITFKGRSGGRTIVEVDLGNGQKQLFYKSTGSAKKAGSGVGGSTEGLWQPYAGHSSDAGKGWFGKDAGYKDWYKSQSYRDIAGNLDVLATKKGINLNMQMDLSTDLSKAAKSKPYSELTNADLDEAFANYKKRVGPDQADIANIKYD